MQVNPDFNKMSWLCSASSQSKLTQNLKSVGIIKSERVYEAMKATDRKYFCPVESEAYQDSPYPIGWNATISAPHMHAYALEYLLPGPGQKCLDVGCGSGYLVACMSQMVGPNGFVVGIEHIQGLVDLSIRNLEKTQPPLLQNYKIIAADGRNGSPEDGPFDRIHVGAWSEKLPEALIEQLAPGGKMFIPTGSPQQVYHVEKDFNGMVKTKKDIGVRYVPLTSAKQQLCKNF